MCIHWILLLFRKSSKSKRTPTSVTRYNQFEISDDEDDDITTEQKPPNSLVAGVNNREQSPTVSVKLELTGDIDIISEETIFNKPDQTLLIDSSAYFHLPIDSSVRTKSQHGLSYTTKSYGMLSYNRLPHVMMCLTQQILGYHMMIISNLDITLR